MSALVCVCVCVACVCARACVLDFHLRLLLLYGHLKFCTSLEIEQGGGLFICLRYCASSTALGFAADLMRGERLCCREISPFSPKEEEVKVFPRKEKKKRRMMAMMKMVMGKKKEKKGMR